MKHTFINLFIFSLFSGSLSAEFNYKADCLINHVKASIINAANNQSKLSSEILQLHGMSGKKVRHLLNNICAYPNTTYLEIGVWKGSTFISALYQNQDYINEAVGIDNWSEFGGPFNDFVINCHRFLNNINYRCVYDDAFKIDVKNLFHNRVTVYFYDGNHEIRSHLLALQHYKEILEDVFVLIVDDWNWIDIRNTTFLAIKALKFEVLYEKQILTFDYNCTPANWSAGKCNHEGWWNGLYIAVLKKTKN